MILEVQAPSPGESVTEITVGTWYKKSGDIVARDEKIVDIESDKAMLELYSEEAGLLTVLVPTGETVAVGSIVCKIDTSAAGSAPVAAPAAAAQAVVAVAAPVAAVPAAAVTNYATATPSPSAQKLMTERALAPTDLVGTGRDGRITKGDVIAVPNLTAAPAAPSKAAPAPAPAAPVGERGEHRQRMTKLRQTLANRLVTVKNETAMLTTFNEVDMGAIFDVRKKYKDSFKEKHGVGLGFMSFFTKACSAALMEFPQVNAYIDGDELVFHDYVDMGVAVSTDRGLMVPVLRNAERLTLAQIEAGIADMAGRARQNKLSIAEMQGGTFTITNGGVFGSLMSTPILNPPQSAILGMHKIQERPMVVNGQVVVRPMMYLAVSYDHRVIDGKESVSFLVRVKEFLEDPVRLMLGV